MTPVMEELVRPPSDAPVKREAEGAEPQPEGPARARRSPRREGRGRRQGHEHHRGPGRPGRTRRRRPADRLPGRRGRRRRAAPTGARTTPRAAARTPPSQTGLADVPHVEPEGEEEDLGEQVFHYDEWDHKIEDYRPAWCTLTEHRQTRTQEGFVAATFHEFGGIVTQIRRNFQLMRPEALRKMRYQEDGDDLDTDGLVEYVVDRRARISPTPRVYIKRDKRDRDVTTAFLVDMSSSTDRKIDGRKRIIDIEKEALLLMCEALEAIRDEYAIYGFSGSGREDCEFYVVKELGERYDDRVKGRIGGIYARQKTRMGPALRHATRRLAARRLQREADDPAHRRQALRLGHLPGQHLRAGGHQDGPARGAAREDPPLLRDGRPRGRRLPAPHVLGRQLRGHRRRPHAAPEAAPALPAPHDLTGRGNRLAPPGVSDSRHPPRREPPRVSRSRPGEAARRPG